MKRIGSTWIMVALVLAIGGFAIYEYKQSETDEVAKVQEGRLFSETDFDRIQLSQNNQTLVALEKTDSVWKLKSPVEDQVDEQAVSTYVDDIASQKAKTLDTEGAIKWEEFGFESAQVQKFELTTASKKILVLLVSPKTAYDGSTYIKFSDKLYLGAAAWTRLASKSALDFRNKQILSPSFNLSELSVDGVDHFDLVKDGEKWKFKKGPSFPLETSLVENFITDIKALKAQQFVSETKDPKVLSDTGLQKPIFKIKLTLAEKDQAPIELQFGQKHGVEDFFVTTSTRPQIFKVARILVEKLNKSSLDLRDRKEPFRFNLEKVQTVSIHTALTSVDVKKNGTTWELAQPAEQKQLDVDKLQELFEKLKNLEVDTFSFKVAPKGLTPPKNSVVMKDAEGSVVYSLFWGDEYQRDKNSPPTYFVKTSLVKEVVGVKTGAFSVLPFQTLIKSSPKQ